jgi:hypothetical protein
MNDSFAANYAPFGSCVQLVIDEFCMSFGQQFQALNIRHIAGTGS